MYGPTRAKRGEKSGDLNSRKLHKRFLELRSCDLLGGRLALMTTSDRCDAASNDGGQRQGAAAWPGRSCTCLDLFCGTACSSLCRRLSDFSGKHLFVHVWSGKPPYSRVLVSVARSAFPSLASLGGPLGSLAISRSRDPFNYTLRLGPGSVPNYETCLSGFVLVW